MKTRPEASAGFPANWGRSQSAAFDETARLLWRAVAEGTIPDTEPKPVRLLGGRDIDDVRQARRAAARAFPDFDLPQRAGGT